MQVNANTVEKATNIQQCMMMHKLQHKTAQDNNLQQLKGSIIKNMAREKEKIYHKTSGYTGHLEMTW